ncbi:60S ribosomal protein L5-2 [Forsythia ovata]|uniref:60S ribosomal protein L5-2 n=1 Tax=Forsythia ovata TaxID=205694 RepID=A0ABD1T4V0_9LAMI
MDEEYEGNVEATGEDSSVEPAESRRPFRTLLDVGLIRTTTDNRVFGALKTLIEDEPEKYQTHFSEYIKRGIDEDGLEEMYKKVHAAIRADPTLKKSEKQPPNDHKRRSIVFLTRINIHLSHGIDKRTIVDVEVLLLCGLIDYNISMTVELMWWKIVPVQHL